MAMVKKRKKQKETAQLLATKSGNTVAVYKNERGHIDFREIEDKQNFYQTSNFLWFVDPEDTNKSTDVAIYV